MPALLEVTDLRVQFQTDDGLVRAVDGVSYELAPGETVGLVGESGSGKSVSNLALLGLIPQPPGKIASGHAIYHGQDLLRMAPRQLREVRGRRIAMIFQDPMTALNPFLTVAEQLTEVTRRHLGHSRKQSLDHAVTVLERVGIPGASRRIFEYPHNFSGGMRQRVMIAIALSCRPDVLIADEPTTALDVTIQAQILDLLRELQQAEGTAIVLITHDLGVIAHLCHRVHVMYAGRVVEEASVDDLFHHPRHPYTLGLLASMPRLDTAGQSRLTPIDGQPPDLARLPMGCAFRPRCRYAIERCATTEPALTPSALGRHACFVDVDMARALAGGSP